MAREPQVRIVEAVAEGKPALVALPRYEALTQLLPRLVEQGVRFQEIAGNDEIMVTVLAPRGWRYDGGGAETLLTMPILTQPDRERQALRVPVGALHAVIGDLTQPPAGSRVSVEHVYDY
jgi:hypothetical protein